ncbi:MAG TPA: hypothetical protein VK665_03900 [Candidatus Elarobacter sp.]|nr:hypothetical protein [Candidatus Elarobacter sp.]
MLRTVLVGLAVAATTIGALASAADAPADEYFGPFKYSAISVRTKIDALGRSYRERWADDASLVHDAQMIESSFRVWAQRYPKDKWLPPTAFHLAQLYQEIQTQDARNHARAMYAYLAKAFPSSKEAHLARLRLQQGFPPLQPEPPVSPTPNPYAPSGTPASPGASPASPGSPGAAPAPASSAAPAASPASAPASTTAPAAPAPSPAASAAPHR